MSGVAVVGAGPGGLAVAADLALAGERVALYDVDERAVAPVADAGGIAVSGKLEGFARVAADTDSAAAVADTDAVVIVVPGTELTAAARALAPHLSAGHVVVAAPGGTGGALELGAALRRAEAPVAAVVEAGAFPYACSVPEPAAVQIASIKRAFGVALLPGADRVERLQDLFPRARLEPSVLHTGLANMNAVLHVAPMVVNAGWIESDAVFEFYGDGITPAVAALVAEFDAERLAVAAALAVEVPSLEQWIATTYGVTAASLFEAIQVLQREVYRSLPAPATLQHRFLLEDVPCGAVPVLALGEALGVPLPLHALLVALASRLCGADFAASGRTAGRLGLEGADAAAIRRAVGLAG